MTLEDLRVFVTAYEAESLSEAARASGCTQGAIAQHVRKLERELGAALFARVPRGVTPTQAGRVLYEGARSALSNLEQAIAEVAQVREGQNHKLRLAASASGASGPFLRPAILALQQRNPRAVIELVNENTAEQRLDALRQNRAELAIAPLNGTMRGLEVRPCMELPLGLAVHRQHPFARKKQLELSDLASIHYIAQAQTSGTYQHVDSALRAAGVRLEPSQIAADPRTGMLMVELGRGETFAPLMVTQNLERSGQVKVVPVPALPPIRIGLIARSFKTLPAVAGEFVEVFERFVRKLASEQSTIRSLVPRRRRA